MTIDPADLAYDLMVQACGRDWYVARTNALAKKVEQRFGAIYPLSLRLRSNSLKIVELAQLVHLLIEDKENAPSAEAVEAWAFRAGAGKLQAALAGEMLSLIAGNDAVAEVLSRRGPKDPDDPGPFGRTAA